MKMCVGSPKQATGRVATAVLVSLMMVLAAAAAAATMVMLESERDQSSSSRGGFLFRSSVLVGEEEGSSPVTNNSNLHINNNSGKVSVQISIESLCIDCKHYMLEQVVPTMASPLALDNGGIFDLDIVVYGNAQIHTATQTVTCQHGNAECDANVWEQCAVNNYAGVPARYVPFLACLYNDLPMGHAETPYDTSMFAHCARVAAMDFHSLQACHDMDAWAMQVQAASRTPKAHDHVPWLVIDGQHVDEESNNGESLISLICQALARKGGAHDFCNQF